MHACFEESFSLHAKVTRVPYPSTLSEVISGKMLNLITAIKGKY